MDKLDVIAKAAVESVAEKAMEQGTVQLNIVRDLGLAGNFFINSPFGNKTRLAEVTRDSYLVAKRIHPRFIFNDCDGKEEKRIIFRSELMEPLSPGVNKFIISRDNSKNYILCYQYTPMNRGLIYCFEKEREEQRDRIKQLENRVRYLEEDIRDFQYEMKQLKRKLDDMNDSRRY
jgi:hypothetical protein